MKTRTNPVRNNLNLWVADEWRGDAERMSKLEQEHWDALLYSEDNPPDLEFTRSMNGLELTYRSWAEGTFCQILDGKTIVFEASASADWHDPHLNEQQLEVWKSLWPMPHVPSYLVVLVAAEEAA